MDCTQCGKPIKTLDSVCPHCDTPQNPSPSPAPLEQSSETVVKNEVVELARRAMGGDDSVWGEIYEKTHRYVYFMALKFLRSEQDAQDITQEVYIQTIRSIGQLYSADSFYGWLRTIIYSKCKDFVKKKRPALLEDEAQGWLENMPEMDDTFLPDMTLDSAESRRMILELIDALPYQQRQTVLFYYYDEMTIDQIAALMECPAGTVKSRLNYARQQIKNGVEEHERKGVKLYGIATLPILTLLLRGQAEAMSIPSTLGSSVAPIIQGIGVPSSAAPGTTVAYGAATTTGTSTVALSTKIILCVLAAVIVIGGGIFVWLNSGNGDYTDPPVATPPPVVTPDITVEPDATAEMEIAQPMPGRMDIWSFAGRNLDEVKDQFGELTESMEFLYHVEHPFTEHIFEGGVRASTIYNNIFMFAVDFRLAHPEAFHYDIIDGTSTRTDVIERFGPPIYVVTEPSDWLGELGVAVVYTYYNRNDVRVDFWFSDTDQVMRISFGPI